MPMDTPNEKMVKNCYIPNVQGYTPNKQIIPTTLTTQLFYNISNDAGSFVHNVSKLVLSH